MELSDRHRHFLWVEQAAIPAVFNLLINGAIAWLLFRSITTVPLWGESSSGVDLLITGFLLPFLTCLIVSALVRRQVASGALPPLPTGQLPLSGWFRRSVPARGAALGVAGMLFGAAPVVLALDLAGAPAIAAGSFVAYKAIGAAALALLVTPFVGWWALASASEARAAAPLPQASGP